ncbi:MAG TPA: S4 domain-containing protein [Steroidobacteraceae bacterium]|nr:S4 domain-containing protein [Steroidobacteraceae bacterium]
MSERLNKVLAQHGIGSRRDVERWITEGRLELNGRRVKLGDRYADGDRVTLDGRDVTKRLGTQVNVQVLAYHKPQGQAIERTQDEEASDDTGETVMERLPKQRGVRWVPINPMHAGDSGLLLLTNDGSLSYALTRQKKNIPTAYMVRVHVRGGVAAAPALPLQIMLDGQLIAFTSVEASGGEGENVWYKVVMPRADKRAAVRALFVSHGLTVSRMMQVAFAGIELTKDLPRSRHRLLKPSQVDLLHQAAQHKSEPVQQEKMRTGTTARAVKVGDAQVKSQRPAARPLAASTSNRSQKGSL